MSKPQSYRICECGHSWWDHHWDSTYEIANDCMTCMCQTYSETGTSCYWVVELLYEMEKELGYRSDQHITTWIGDDIRYEREKRKKSSVVRRSSEWSRNSTDDITEY